MSDTSAPSGTGLPHTLPTGIRIRRATPVDAVLVDTLVREIAAHQGDHVQATAADWESMLARDDVRVLLALDGERPVGYVSTLRRFHLWSASDLIALDDLWVRPEARDRGVGRELMEAVAELARPERLAIVWGARADNEAAHRFYLRLGAAMTTKAMFSWRPTS
ncbi:GNAT family N-acetyltransferase [Microbacterium sp. CFH 90308]|uniref:GNAT family N-acetyltransferase n=1 Tax=Microbacterium salsuginis TaxID=2722803 RepID=A0ABX1K8J9_9MICO|nr:GNAT family N-acetyltransferase [Microbacterium sp. CFH 90308]NLP82425.1 GNAT family N-acetyltransferase [Microbacterium sp. CFH 90308]